MWLSWVTVSKTLTNLKLKNCQGISSEGSSGGKPALKFTHINIGRPYIFIGYLLKIDSLIRPPFYISSLWYLAIRTSVRDREEG